ncbi:unnamed protein product [Cuscuta campestris]|uniref:Thioredoxin-like fold domain-containing protein n=1 Tax=Cuscuta campestris TaxID=132261 RepID=A0A484NHG4_9ASTE|nr:unnamed protein product [Cuscuta campestris]
MELKRRRNDEVPSGTNGESKSSSKGRRRSSTTPKIALSDRTVKLLEEKVSFPNVSKLRRRNIRALILSPSLSKENKIGSYFDSQSPIYSESFVDVLKVEVGKQLNVFDLLGGNLLRFSTKFTSYVGSCDPNKGEHGVFEPGNGRTQTPVLRRCGNVVRGGVVSASATSTTTGGNKENVSVESTLSLKGKYVMICCVFVPSLWCSEDGPGVYYTSLASHELARRDDFVMVVVPMMREGFTHSHSAYQHFLSGFSCLAVPFEDSHRREFICSSLGFDGKLKALLLDPSHRVLHLGPPRMFEFYGGSGHDCLPFTPRGQKIVLTLEDDPENRSLDEVLGLSDTDVLYNIEYLAGGGRLKEEKDGCIAISKLKQRVVGLYMCSDGRSLEMIQEVYEDCRRKEYELEIVVVCYPFPEQVPPALHEEAIIEALASHDLLRWWFFPFNNTVCHRLETMCEIYGLDECFLIADPSVERCVDPYGIEIIRDFGIDCYPFTRRSLVETEFHRKTELRLNSLLLPWEVVHASIDLESTISIPVVKLKNKIVLLYLYKEGMKYLANKLAAWYKNNIKGKYSNVEVVAVSIDGSDTSDEEFMGMGWLACHGLPPFAAKL